MSIQYPHTLEAQVFSDSTTGPKGEIIPGSGNILRINCRYRPNTMAKEINTVDGKTVVYRGTCYIAKGSLPIANGDLIEVPGFVDKPTAVLQIHHASLRTRLIL